MTQTLHLSVRFGILATCFVLTCARVYAQPIDTTSSQGRAALTLRINDETHKESLCFSAQSLRDHINAQLGYDAFLDEEHASLSLVVSVSRPRGATWTATLESSRGAELRTRTLSSPECNDLLDAVVFSLTLVIDPVRASSATAVPPIEHARRLLGVARARAQRQASLAQVSAHVHRARSTSQARARRPFPSLARPAPRPERAPATDEAMIPETSAQSPSPGLLYGILGVSARAGMLPTPGTQLTLGVRRSQGWRALEATVQTVIPMRYRSLGGEVTLSTHTLTLAACGEHASSWLSVCANLAAGAFRGRGRHLPGARTAHGVLWAPGLGVHPVLRLGDHVALRLDVVGQWLVTRAEWRVGTQIISESQPLTWAVGTSLLFSRAR